MLGTVSINSYMEKLELVDNLKETLKTVLKIFDTETFVNYYIK